MGELSVDDLSIVLFNRISWTLCFLASNKQPHWVQSSFPAANLKALGLAI
jgi:hypothetical protein